MHIMDSRYFTNAGESSHEPATSFPTGKLLCHDATQCLTAETPLTSPVHPQ
jgi:hypothetical protein